MGLRLKGSVKWGMTLLVLVLLATFLSFTPTEQAQAQMPATHFDYHGFVKYPNGSFINDTNVTIEVVDFNVATIGPPYVNSSFSNLSTVDGKFNVTNVTSAQTLNYQVKIKKYKGSYHPTQGLVTWIGPSLPPFPQFFMTNDSQGLLNATYTLERGANLNLSIFNSAGTQINFSYMLMDSTLGYPIDSPDFNDTANVYSKIVHVPYNRNYTVQFFPFQAPPIEVSITNLSLYNESPDCFANDDCIYIVNLTTNASFGPVYVHGYINTTVFGTMNDSSSNLTNLSATNYMVFSGSDVSADGTMPSNMGQFLSVPPLPNDVVNASGTNGTPHDGPFYNITLPGTNDGFEVLLVFYGYADETENNRSAGNYYIGYQNVTAFINTPDIEHNVTLHRLAGAGGTHSFNDQSIGTIVTNVTIINMTSTDSAQPVGQAHTEVSFTIPGNPTVPGGRNYRWFVQTDSATSTAKISIPNSTTDLKIQAFSGNFAPLKKKITNTILNTNSTLTIQLFTMDIGDPDSDFGSGDLKTSVAMDFYTSSATCDIPLPAATCLVATFGDASMFNPMQAMLGGAVSLRMTHSNGVAIHYANVDMFASGPPDGSMDTEAGDNATGGVNFGETWKFGSQGPDVYDHILVAIPYSDEPGDLNDSSEINFSMKIFYDDDWNVIWNTTTNGTNATLLAENHSDYSAFAPTWQILMNNNTCITDGTAPNYTNPCWLNITANEIWIRLPHFSGSGPTVSGSVTETPVAAASSGDDSGGGGGGGGGATTSTNPKKTSIFGTIEAGEDASMSIDSTAIAVTQVDFTLLNEVKNAKLSVEALEDGKPEALPDPFGTTYQYLEVTATNIANTDLAGTATILFSIEDTWFTENGVDKNHIVLYRYTTGWDALNTIMTEEADGVVTYEAKTPGFSTFVISTGEEAITGMCGDGVCDAGEDASSCPADCATPAEGGECSSGQSRCSGAARQTCQDQAWVTVEDCEFGCNSFTAACHPAPFPTTPEEGDIDSTMLILLVVIVVVVVGVFFYTRRR